ncbi:MAG: hypothetical protein FJ151_02585 [Euryarchaeota archaeon]|nr:hypothetical protein [Euryarchaeota archaeon]
MAKGALDVRLVNGAEFLGRPRCFFDPEVIGPAGIHCISHAHQDHLPRTLQGDKAICSELTRRCASSRLGTELRADTHPQIEMRDSGHIPGSTMFLVKGSRRVLYTGDFSPRDRLGIAGAKPVKTDIMIVEATHGSPRYVFPPTEEMIKVLRDWVEDTMSQGSSVALFAYPLGKSQEMISLLADFVPYVHGSIASTTRLVRGNAAPDYLPYSRDAVKEPFVIICPTGAMNSSLIRYWKRTGMRTAAVSGWAIDPSFRYRMGVDEAFPLSDHADFEELISFVKECDPSVVYAQHGFASELAKEIGASLGLEAHPLLRNQKSLLEF